jgi:hypothetical protein
MVTARPFHQVAGEIFSLHEAKRYRDALTRLNEISPHYPDRADAIAYWRACLHSLLNEPSDALAVLHTGLGEGLWWAPDMLAHDPDLEPLREEPEFVEIVRECETRLTSARDHATSEMEIARPASPEAAPLLLALHWRGRSPADFNPRWRPAADHGAIVAIPRSSQQLGMNTFGWTTANGRCGS